MAAGSPTFYEVLGVSRRASTEEIRRAYLEQARRLHPDTGAGHAQVRAMQRVNEAWSVLRDTQRRLAYDRELAGDPFRTDADVDLPTAFDVPDDVDPAAFLAEEPVAGTTRSGDLFVLVPAALLVAGIGALAFGTMTLGSRVLALGFALFAASGVSFMVMPFVALVHQRRARR